MAGPTDFDPELLRLLADNGWPDTSDVYGDHPSLFFSTSTTLGALTSSEEQPTAFASSLEPDQAYGGFVTEPDNYGTLTAETRANGQYSFSSNTSGAQQDLIHSAMLPGPHHSSPQSEASKDYLSNVTFSTANTAHTPKFPRYFAHQHHAQPTQSGETSAPVGTTTAEPLDQHWNQALCAPFSGPTLPDSSIPSTTRNSDSLLPPIEPGVKLRPIAPANRSTQIVSQQQRSVGAISPDKSQSSTMTSTPRKRRTNSITRAEVKKVRKIGACVRCRMLHEKCSDTTPCNKCQEVSASALWIQPCGRFDLKDVMTFRAGSSRAAMLRCKLSNPAWACDDKVPREIRLMFPFKNPSSTEPQLLTVSVRKIRPGPRDFLVDSYTGQDGKVHSIKHPAFACDNTAAASRELKSYTERCRPDLEREMIEALSEDDQMMTITLDEVQRVARTEAVNKGSEDERLVSLALRLLTTVYFSGPALLIADTSIIPLPENNDGPGGSLDFAGKVPAPSVLDTQLDTLLIQHMIGLLSQVQQQMKRLYFGESNPKQHWFEIYLCTYLLLTSLELVHRHLLGIMRESRTVGEDFCTRVNFYCNSMIEEWEWSAQNLLYHFRALLRGMAPFGELSEKDLAHILNEDNKGYFAKMKELVEEEGPELELARNDAENKTYVKRKYWISQLFLHQEARSG